MQGFFHDIKNKILQWRHFCNRDMTNKDIIIMRYYNGKVLKINWAKIFTPESEN